MFNDAAAKPYEKVSFWPRGHLFHVIVLGDSTTLLMALVSIFVVTMLQISIPLRKATLVSKITF